MLITILKYGSQILLVVVGALNVVQAHRLPQGQKGKWLTLGGWFALAILFISFFGFIGLDYDQDATQQKTISELERVNQSLFNMRVDRDLLGIEIAFKPSTDQWRKIAELTDKIVSPGGPEFPYSAAIMKAERRGDHWKIDFGPIKSESGTIRPGAVLSNQPNGKAFEEVIQKASIPLWIKWGAGSETEIEPLRYDYPSAITISQDAIVFTLSPPLLRLNLNSLNANPTILLRTKETEGTLPKSFKFRSLDSIIALDQSIDLEWKKEEGNSGDDDIYIKRTKPYISGPHRLQLSFKPILPGAPKASG